MKSCTKPDREGSCQLHSYHLFEKCNMQQHRPGPRHNSHEKMVSNVGGGREGKEGKSQASCHY